MEKQRINEKYSKESLNDSYEHIKKEILDIIQKNPINPLNLKEGVKVRLWSGLENKTKYSFGDKEPAQLINYLGLITPGINEIFPSVTYCQEIEKVMGETTYLKSGDKINYKFLEREDKVDDAFKGKNKK